MWNILGGQRVLVAGGTSGFGLRVAQLAIENGAEVIVTGRDLQGRKDALTKLQARNASSPVAVQCEYLDASDVVGLETFFENVGPFDHFVSTVGGAMGGGFIEAPLATIHQAVNEKFFANLQLARLAVSRLRDGGSMILTAGSGGRPHNASGAIVGNDAIRTLVQGLAVELAPRHRVNAVAPTWTRTPLWRNVDEAEVDAIEKRFSELIPLKRTATIDEVASTYLFLMSNGFINGQTIAVDGGVTLVS